MITGPLDLSNYLHKPHFRMNVVPFVDGLLIGLCIFILGSRYVLAPGVSVDLPKASHIKGRYVVSVLTVRHDNMLIYEGNIYNLNEFKRVVQKSFPGKESGNAVLLFKLNKDVGMQTFLDLCDIARDAGFVQVQVAAESGNY